MEAEEKMAIFATELCERLTWQERRALIVEMVAIVSEQTSLLSNQHNEDLENNFGCVHGMLNEHFLMHSLARGTMGTTLQ